MQWEVDGRPAAAHVRVIASPRRVWLVGCCRCELAAPLMYLGATRRQAWSISSGHFDPLALIAKARWGCCGEVEVLTDRRVTRARSLYRKLPTAPPLPALVYVGQEGRNRNRVSSNDHLTKHAPFVALSVIQTYNTAPSFVVL